MLTYIFCQFMYSKLAFLIKLAVVFFIPGNFLGHKDA